MPFSIHGDVDLDQSPLTKPTKSQHHIDGHVANAMEVIDHQAPACPATSGPKSGDPCGDRDDHESLGFRNGRHHGPPRNGTASGGTGGPGGSGGSGGKGCASGGGGMTQTQCRAIAAIAARLGISPYEVCRYEFGVTLESLSLSEASRLIKHLKSLQPAAVDNSRA